MIKINTKKINNILYKINKGEKLKRSETIFHQNIIGTLNSNVLYEYTSDEIEEYIKCYNSPIYFISNYCKINTENGINQVKIFDYQEEIINHYLNNRFCLINKSRQIGYDLFINCIFLWEILFHKKTILNISHKNQSSHNYIEKIREIYLHLPYFLKQPIINFNKNNIKFINGGFIKSYTQSKFVLGSNYNIINLHDFSYYNTNSQNDLLNITPVISALSTSKLLINGNPNKINDFYHNLYINSKRKEKDPLKNMFKTLDIYWWEIPNRDNNWKENIINLIGQNAFDKEYDLKFI